MTKFSSYAYATKGSTARTTTDRSFDAGVFINDFYPPTKLGLSYTATFGPGGTLANNTSQKLSLFYANASLAAQDYPFITTMGITDLTTCEVDWAAWMKAFLYVYNRDNGLGKATFYPFGQYKIDRTIQCALTAPRIVGEGSGMAQSTRMQWNGPHGTQNSPNYMFYFAYISDWIGTPNQPPVALVKQPGATINQASPVMGIQFENMTLVGINGFSMTGDDPDVACGYVSGIRIGVGGGTFIQHNGFANLYDAIVVTGRITETHIVENGFSAIYRDCVHFCSQTGSSDYSTTMEISRNSFNTWNRYAILINIFGGVGVYPIIKGNIFEVQQLPTGGNYYLEHPQHFLQGIPSCVAVLNSDRLYFGENYFEIGQWNFGFLHLVNCAGAQVEVGNGSGDGFGLVLSTEIGTINNTAGTISGNNLTLNSGAYGTYTCTTTTVGSGPGSITTLHVSAILTGPGLGINSTITGTDGTNTIPAGTTIVSQTNGPPGGIGDYILTTGHSPTPGDLGSCTVTSSGVSRATFYPGMGISSSSVPTGTIAAPGVAIGTVLVSGSGNNWVVSPSQTVTVPVQINATVRSGPMITATNAQGFSYITDTCNYPVGTVTNSNNPSNGPLVLSGVGNIMTVGNVGISSGLQITGMSTVSQVFDYEVDETNSNNNAYGPIPWLSTCNGATATGTTLTVGGTYVGPMPWKQGQVVYGNAVGFAPSPFRAAFTSPLQSILPGGSGGAGAYTLNPGIGGLVFGATRPLFAVKVTQRKLSDLNGGIVGLGNLSLPSLSSLTQNGATIKGLASFGLLGLILEAFTDTDNIRTLRLFNSIFLRLGTGSIDATASTKQNGYKGIFLMSGLSDLTTATTNYVNMPALFANVYDANGNFLRYVEAAVLRTVKERDGTGPPTTGTWKTGDIFNNNAPGPGNFGRWLCVSGGSPGIWAGMGSVMVVTTVASLPLATLISPGCEAIVTNALNPVVGQQVAGGGSTTCKVWCTGTSWHVEVIGI